MNKTKYKTHLNIINKVIKTDLIYKYSHLDGMTLHWRENLIQDNYTKQEFVSYIYQYMFLITKYPKVFMYDRIYVYYFSSHIYGIENSKFFFKYNVYNKWYTNEEWYLKLKYSKWLFTKTISPNMRYNVLQSFEDFFQSHSIFYNHTIPIIFIVLFCIYLAFCKQYYEFLLIGSVLIKVPIIFLTEPTPFFLYWLSFHLIGYFVLYYFILYLLSKKRD